MIELNSENFDVVNSGISLIDFWAPWCGPCKAIAPTLEALSTEYTNINFYKVNIDDNDTLALKFEIRAIPTVIILKDGVVVDQIMGAVTRKDYKKRLDKIK